MWGTFLNLRKVLNFYHLNYKIVFLIMNIAPMHLKQVLGLANVFGSFEKRTLNWALFSYIPVAERIDQLCGISMLELDM